MQTSLRPYTSSFGNPLRRVILFSLSVVIVATVVVVGNLALQESFWSYACGVDGSYRHRHKNVVFVKAYTNDDNVVNNISHDPNDDGTDPGFDKPVARCLAKVHDKYQVQVTIENGYPGYTCQIWTQEKNVGKNSLRCTSLSVSEPEELSVVMVAPSDCGKLRAGRKKTMSFVIQIEQSAQESSLYRFSIEKVYRAD